jgi:dolichol-phosphate mannosyltransferase
MREGTAPSTVENKITQATVSVIVPTLREADNIPELVRRLDSVRKNTAGLKLELLLMDDNSRDGSVELVESLHLDWVRIVVRTANHGLSLAVLDGLRQATGDVLVVMDADLSHPPEKIPEMMRALTDGADMAVGSRFSKGGTTADSWGFLRWLNSRVAIMLAMPLTTLKDPMSGFFAMRRATLAAGRDFSPLGYKIGLELIIKCRCARVVEIPIHFSNRYRGKSKLSFKEQLRYLRHIRRLYVYKLARRTSLAREVPHVRSSE